MKATLALTLIRLRSMLFGLAVAAVLLAGCTADQSPTPSPESIALLTEPAPAQACMEALAMGTLVFDPRSTLAIGGPSGERTPVMWPFGYSARLVDGTLELLDNRGQLVAREGDRIEMGGGFGAGNLFYACSGSVQRTGP